MDRVVSPGGKAATLGVLADAQAEPGGDLCEVHDPELDVGHQRVGVGDFKREIGAGAVDGDVFVGGDLRQWFGQHWRVVDRLHVED